MSYLKLKVYPTTEHVVYIWWVAIARGQTRGRCGI